MKNTRNTLPLFCLIGAMLIFGTIGILRRYIPLGSATLAALRGAIGTVSILLWLLIRKKKPDGAAIRRNFLLLLLSGACIGANWIFLFEAYGHTTIAVATLCYYMAPIFALLGASLLFRDKLSLPDLVCVVIALFGMVCVSGVFGGGGGTGDPLGVVFGLAAALLYSAVVLMNRKIKDISAFDQTLLQLAIAAVVVAPYALLTESIPEGALTLPVILAVLAVGVVQTGFAYGLYFYSLGSLETRTVALFSYLDPAVAVLCSVLILAEPAGWQEILGVLCILGSTFLAESVKKRSA
ncbi:MAG: DMT family transporter [Clostridia bacterium]|nr:DMT family transporter [Clostridia bacterium]